MRTSVVDLFCGAGGLTQGFILEGIRVNAGIDIDPACKFPYEHNNKTPFICADASAVAAEDLLGLYPPGDVRVLAGCAPCQPYSKYSQKNPPRGRRKWGLLRAFSDLIQDARPEIVTMENVPELARHRILTEFTSRLTSLGYKISLNDRLACAGYGVPQTRQRLVLLASLLGPIELTPPTVDPDDYTTVEETIGNLTPIAAGEVSKSDPLHRASALSPLNLRRIRASRPGGSWHDWKANLIAKCHKRNTGRTYSSVYGRMEWGKPAPTLTAQCYGFGNGRFGHPDQDRAISLREAALIQTFGEEYVFTAPGQPIHFTTVGRLIGNAVPVLLGRAVAKSIREHVASHA